MTSGYSSTGLTSVGTRPPFLFNTVSEAIGAVADNGVVHIEPGTTRERGIIGRGKRCVLVAPIGGVTIGLGYRWRGFHGLEACA